MSKENIKPIIGLTITLEDFVVVLYCKNYKGYQNLIKLSTIQNERKVTVDELNSFSSDVISVLPFESRSKYSLAKEIYSDLYLGYSSKLEEKEVLLDTKNVVFFLFLYIYIKRIVIILLIYIKYVMGRLLVMKWGTIF